MEVIIQPDAAAAARLTARLIADAVKAKPAFNLGLATGATMEAVYAELAAMNKRGEVDFSRVSTFNLDEYIGLPPEDKNSYRYYMNFHLFDKINIDKKNTHLPDGMAADEVAEGVRYEAAMKQFGVDLDTPIRDYPKEAYDALMYGTGAKLYTIDRYFDKYAHRQTVPFAGVIPTIESRRNSLPDYYEQFTEEKPCDACHGMRLKPEILSVTVGGKNIHEVCSLSVSDCLDFFNAFEVSLLCFFFAYYA